MWSGGVKVRQANSTIRGFLYQFNKSIYEVLTSEDDNIVTLEGVIEDIDIQSHSSVTTIQCKYHEDKKFQISNVAEPILEMLCHHNECKIIGKSVNYILFAYYAENVEKIELDTFLEFIGNTTNKEIQIYYFHRIYAITDKDILAIANKPKKTKQEKEKLCTYYKNNRESLMFCVDVQAFWSCFKYSKATKFDTLQENIVEKLREYSDDETSKNLYYPNAFALISELSSKTDINERKITKTELLEYLGTQKSILISKWSLAAINKSQILKSKKTHLSSLFAPNVSVRSFVFSDDFLERNAGSMGPFIYDYTEKYFKKKTLQKPPIFIFGDNSEETMNNVILSLHRYQKSINSGNVANRFVASSFVNDTDCASDFICKITLLKNINSDILESCNVNQSYIIGSINRELVSSHFITEKLDIKDMQVLRYLIGLDKTWEVN